MSCEARDNPDQLKTRSTQMKLSAKRLSIAILVLCFSFALAVVAQQAPRGITPEDYYSFEFISDPNISPDEKLVAYVVTKIERAQNRRNASIWMVATDGSRAPGSSRLRRSHRTRRAGVPTESRSRFCRRDRRR